MLHFLLFQLHMIHKNFYENSVQVFISCASVRTFSNYQRLIAVNGRNIPNFHYLQSLFFFQKALSIHNSSSVWSERKAEASLTKATRQKTHCDCSHVYCYHFVRKITGRDTYIYSGAQQKLHSPHSLCVPVLVSDPESVQSRGRNSPYTP
jgi:hypothetical protein